MIYAKSDVNKTIIAVLAFLALLFCSCRATYVDHFEYCRRDFCARVSGVVDGVEIDTVVRYCPANTENGESAVIMTVAFSSPESLDGLVATLYSDGKSAVRLGDYIDNSGSFDGLLLPFRLLCPLENYSSINIKGGDTEIIFTDSGKEVSYLFDADGKLYRISGEAGGRTLELEVSFES